MIFNKLSLIVQTVKWASRQKEFPASAVSGLSLISGNTIGSLLATKFREQFKKQYEVALDFEISIESLKIACNFPEIKPKKKTYIMDCLVFLDKVKV